MAASRQARIAAPHGGRPVSVASVRLPTKAPKLLDLFSGIGGFSLGLERAGFQTVAFCEIEAFPRRVLAHHWPDVPIYDDVRDLTAVRLRADGIGDIDAICGGFPCQDVSLAGGGAGLDGERSGLWREFARLVGELRPFVVFVENVGALLGRGLAAVLADLAALGYDAQWHAVPAAAVGADHLRDRVWITATAADAAGPGLPQLRGLQRRLARALAAASAPWQGAPEPIFLPLVHGVSSELDRRAVKALGNAVVPQIPEILGRAVLEAA